MQNFIMNLLGGGICLIGVTWSFRILIRAGSFIGIGGSIAADVQSQEESYHAMENTRLKLFGEY